MQGLFFGSSTWARTRDLRINRNPGSSNIYINQWLTSEKHKRVIFRVIEKQLHISTVWYFEQSNGLDFFDFTTGKMRVGLRLQPLTAKGSTPRSGLELDQLSGIGIENRGIPRAIGLQLAGALLF